MISLTLAWYMLKRMPRIILLILLIISVFILCFLLMGCTSSAGTYSSIYIVDYQFNKSSPMYPLIKTSFEEKNVTSYQDLKISAGYLGICVKLENSTECLYKGKLSSYQALTGVKFYTSNSTSTQLDILQVATEFSNKISHPYILIATIILTLILLLTLLYVVIPSLPFKQHVNKFNLALAPILALLWGLGSMWVHVAAHSGKNLVEIASMYILKADVGNKASAMTWTPFTFLVIVAIGVWGLQLRDIHRKIEEVDPKV